MHDHEAKQIWLILGSIRCGNVTMATGDFLEVSKGIENDGITTENSMLFWYAHRGTDYERVGGNILAGKLSRKEELTALAIEKMQTQGYSALGLRGLAEAASMQAASLYSHFCSKDDLARHAMCLYAARQLSEMVSLEKGSSGGQRILDYVAMVERNLLDQRRLCLALMLTVERNALSPEVVRELKAFAMQNYTWLGTAWNLGRDDLSIRSALPGAMAGTIIFNAMEGIMAIALLDEEPTKRFHEQMLALLTGLGLDAMLG